MTEKQLEILKQISEQLSNSVVCDRCVARDFCETSYGHTLTCKDTIAVFLGEAFSEN